MPVQTNHQEFEFNIQTGSPPENPEENGQGEYVEIIDPEVMSDVELWDKFHIHDDDFLTFGRRSVIQAWLAGHVLCGLKERIPHGEWLNALDEHDVANQTANRYMRLRRAYEEIPQLEEFDSITAAMKALQPKKQDLWTEVDVEGVSTGSVSAGGSENDEEPEDAGWEIMQEATEKAREGLETCEDTLERYGLASVLIGWLSALGDEMRQALIDYGKPAAEEEQDDGETD